MDMDEKDARSLIEKSSTTKEEKDPGKPLILDGDFVKPNPDFNLAVAEREAREREIERRKNHLGTSFFFNFDPLCNLHQLPGCLGELARGEIAQSLRQRFIDVFMGQCPSDNPPPLGQLEEMLRVKICPQPQPGFNNGEVYLWLPGIPLEEGFVFKILKEFRNSVEKYPIRVNVEGKCYEVLFYGWGFRYF